MPTQQFLARVNRLTSVLGVLLLVSCSPSTSQLDNSTRTSCAPEFAELEFGISSSESQASLKQQWEPLLAILSEAIGRPVKGLYATDYASVIEAMGAGKIQVAWYGGKAYIEAAKRSQAEAFVRTVNVDGSQGYYSHLITYRENPILENIDLEAGNGDQYVTENARDLTFAFNDPNSTSGYLVPSLYVFAQNNIDPNTAFDELVFAGSHEATALAAANNQVDVATNNSETLEMMEHSDPETRKKIKIIWTSPIIPTEPLAYRSDLPECLKDDIRTFFYDYQDSEILNPMGWSDFIPAEDKDWHPIRELDIGKQILDIQNNQNLSDAVKQQQIDALNQQLKSLKTIE